METIQHAKGQWLSIFMSKDVISGDGPNPQHLADHNGAWSILPPVRSFFLEGRQSLVDVDVDGPSSLIKRDML